MKKDKCSNKKRFGIDHFGAAIGGVEKATIALTLTALLTAATWFGCEPGNSSSDVEDDWDASTDSDTDSTTDSTTDTDTDTDSDGDTDSGECTPGELWCHDNWVIECNDDGIWIQQTDCTEEGLLCAAGECVDVSEECAEAINSKSYIGCEYFATTLSNSLLVTPPFTYAIALANNGSEDAEVHIDDGPGGAVSNDYIVPAGEMLTIEDLPWKDYIKKAVSGAFPSAIYGTRKVANAVYHVTSSMPVTAYQFNPLHYSSSDETTFSYTNDASLLLPAHIYRDEYVVMARPTWKVDYFGSLPYQPGFVAILGSDEETTIVEIESTAYTLGSDAFSNESYAPMAPGDSMNGVEIGPYEVLQLFSANEPGCPDSTPCSSYYNCCNTSPTYDLTGTVIRVTAGPNPAVFGGHDCTFVPFSKWACDHLEEQLFPLETWGMRYICSHNVTQAEAEPTVWRILSGSDSNNISFTPASVHEEVTLDKGEYVEFESLADFEVIGEGRVAVGQFMVGQNYTSDTAPPENGDPSMSLAVPVEQYRTSYTFLAPTSYVVNYLTVVHKTGSFPSLDGVTIAGDTVDITDEYSRTNLEIEGGVHDITSEEPFAITVYGFGRYTSYMYPGGLDLKEVDVPVQ